jgi:hypothetical protein
MTFGLTLSIALFFASPPAVSGYQQAVAELERAMVEINTNPSGGIDTLRAALASLQAHGPQLADDPKALELRTMAELALARALLSSGDRAAAAAIVDGTLAGLGDTKLAINQLGPSLGALVEERQRMLADRGRARLRIACSVPCRVYVDERRSNAAEDEGAMIPLGEHRLWIESEQAEPLRTELALDEPGATLTIDYPEPAAIAPAPELIDAPAQRHRREHRAAGSRVAPRWAEVGSLVIGGAAMVAGAVLWALDSKCPRGADPNDLSACPQLFDTRVAGIALVSAGGATALLGGVLLGVDAARVGDRRGHEIALTWTTRF